MNAKGGCLCGAVRFDARDVDVHFHACRCSMCQRWCGGPGFAAVVGDVVFDDETALVRYASSDWAERGFCGRCGSSLFYFLKPIAQFNFQVGTFDDSTVFALAGEIFVDEPNPEFAFAGDHPRQTGAEVIAAAGFTEDGELVDE